VRAAIEEVAERVKAPLFIAGQEWQSYSQHGRLVYQDENGLLDLPLPALSGPHQIDNAGTAIAALRVLADPRIGEEAIAQGLKTVTWPARLQRLSGGRLSALLPDGAELWLDGGHNGPAGPVVAGALSDMARRAPKPTVLIWGMLNTKDPGAFIANFKGMAERVYTLQIPGEANALAAETLVDVAGKAGLQAVASASLEDALHQASAMTPAPRILICGSLYLAGHVLALETGEEASAVSGAAKR
jgi:dihydrofolate synthase/folylpolyglutamate synthase